MKCPNEFILSQYADGELQGSENKGLAAHLEGLPVAESSWLT